MRFAEQSFLIETIQTRISAKTQKKFAILSISDGMESYELPIWPELYEEKGHLLIENRMLLGVLQVDKKEESLRLSCKWLADLTQVNDQMMIECDQAYDKAKHQIARYAAVKSKSTQNNESKGGSSPTPSKPIVMGKVPIMDKAIHLKIDADNMRFSNILKLKALFAEHRGMTPLEICFEGQGKPIALLKIDSPHGVTPSDDFTNAVKEIQGVAF